MRIICIEYCFMSLFCPGSLILFDLLSNQKNCSPLQGMTTMATSNGGILADRQQVRVHSHHINSTTENNHLHKL